jgi:hypothetical protein
MDSCGDSEACLVCGNKFGIRKEGKLGLGYPGIWKPWYPNPASSRRSSIIRPSLQEGRSATAGAARTGGCGFAMGGVGLRTGAAGTLRGAAGVGCAAGTGTLRGAAGSIGTGGSGGGGYIVAEDFVEELELGSGALGYSGARAKPGEGWRRHHAISLMQDAIMVAVLAVCIGILVGNQARVSVIHSRCVAQM